ncbi:cytochrome c oxidase assembly protein [Salmonirosea aquatica]|uniref:Cytochrome c oxidase assembly protein n=1 Tax=Salmonirosea aquatica TaxID=2654236 RepID=A0A7C9BUK3_9BACT|nr:hypothetical protein [Cytophagaceae bacterium SJW1-29]
MNTEQLLTETWDFSPGLLLSIVSMGALYGYRINFRFTRQSVWFLAGLALLLLTLASPLHFLGEGYLFSAHMAQHMLLLLVVPPLLLAGIPAEIFGKNFKAKFKIPPALCWVLGVAIMWFWHIPTIFNATMPTNSGIPICGIDAGPFAGLLHGAQTGTLLVAGLFFCWPILSPLPSHRLPDLKGIAYLFLACIGCSLLGLGITFSSHQLYSAYGSPIDPTGAMHLVRQTWGITPAADQQIGGLLMWVPGCFIYVSAALFLLGRWFGEENYKIGLSD